MDNKIGMTFDKYKKMTSHDIAERLYRGEDGHQRYPLYWWSYVTTLRAADFPTDILEKRGVNIKALLTCFIRGRVVRSATKNWACGIIYFEQEIYNLMATHKLTSRIPITELPKHYLGHTIEGLKVISSLGGEVEKIANILIDICNVRCIEMVQIKRIDDIIREIS